MKDFAGKVAVVTGAASGIGLGLSRTFIRAGMSVAMCDIRKDRLYCDALDSPRRRSCRQACWELAQGLCALLAPVMSYTADEAWEQIPGVEGSVHEQRFPLLNARAAESKWEKLWEVRGAVQAAMEPHRAAKTIGTSLDAAVQIALKEQAEWDLLDTLGESLDDLLVVSSLVRSTASSADSGPVVTVATHEGQKCPRCWNHKGGHGKGEDAALCDRCAAVVA